MSIPIRLPEHLIKIAKYRADLEKRSTAGQIEYWAEIGRLVEENPELPYSMIRDIFISLHEVHKGDIEPYQFGEGNNA